VSGLVQVEETMLLQPQVKEAMDKGNREEATKIQKTLLDLLVANPAKESQPVVTAIRRAQKQYDDLVNKEISLQRSKLYSNFYASSSLRGDSFHDDL